MKLDNWEAISSLLQAGGAFQHMRYEIRNNHGQLHRDDGPAVIYPNGKQEWYRNGARHRDNGPADIHHDGTQYWYRNGLIHRDDGPAITYSDGAQFWYLNGKRFGEDENGDPEAYFL